MIFKQHLNTKSGMSRRNLLRGGAIAAIASPALVGKAIAEGEVNWRVQAHWPKASASFDDSLRVMAAKLAERTDGAFQLELLGDGEFAKGADIYNIVRKNVVPMATLPGSNFLDQSTVAPFVYGMPGCLQEAWEFEHALKNLGLEDIMNEEMEPEGLMFLSEKILPIEMTATKKIETAEDFSGLKVRVTGLVAEYLASAGASPQYIAGAELYQSLSSGVVDAAIWGAAVGAQSMSLWEVCKYHYKPSLAQTTDSYLINLKALEGLSEDMRNALLTTINERFFLRSVEYQHREAIALSEGIAEEGIEVLTLPDDVREKLKATSKKFLEREGQKSELAAAAADVYRDLMEDLGYA